MGIFLKGSLRMVFLREKVNYLENNIGKQMNGLNIRVSSN